MNFLLQYFFFIQKVLRKPFLSTHISNLKQSLPALDCHSSSWMFGRVMLAGKLTAVSNGDERMAGLETLLILGNFI